MRLPGEGSLRAGERVEGAASPFQAGAQGGQGGGAEETALVGEAAGHGAVVAEIDVVKADAPGMLVARVVGVGRAEVRREGRAGLVVARAVLGAQDARQDEVEEGIVGVGDTLFVAPIPVAPLHLVVAAPGDQRWMAGQPAHLVGRFALDVGQEGFVGAGVLGAGKDELLPDEDALLVAQLVEVVAFVQPAAPDAQQVGVGFQRAVDQHWHNARG